MKEIIYSIEEFKAKIDPAKPLHHSATRKRMDPHGIFHSIIFRIYGIDKNAGHIVIFETQTPTTAAELKEQHIEYQRLVEQYAKPLGSTEGAWQP
ncbi:MAG: hypothetical protein NWE99_07200 [Candidatus Bathyarchaeota archaeon]|nr:hypothetical protein [Candidatus Bathyarchaeota archaeon]